jgi:hypothetical protein
MSKVKLFTRKYWLVVIPSILVGCIFYLYRTYSENGGIQPVEWMASAIALLVGVGICWLVAWWGNHEEK